MLPVITAYAIANVIVIPMTSWLTAIWKTKLFCRFNIIFTVLRGNATNIWELVTFRFIQGLGGGALLVTAQTIITELPNSKEGWHKPSTEWCDCRTYGPTIRGYIVDRFSWPYIFYINIPLGSSQPFDSKLCKKSKIWRKTEVESSRLARNYSSGIFIGSLQFVLEHGQQDDWFNNKLIVLLSAVSVFGVILFIWRQLTYKYPIVNLSVLKDGNLRIGTLMAFILGFGLYGLH
jgi:DHA2 family multidrug resistance protein